MAEHWIFMILSMIFAAWSFANAAKHRDEKRYILYGIDTLFSVMQFFFAIYHMVALKLII